MTRHYTSTICAPATAPGGAIGIIRLSGPEAIHIVSQIFRPINGTSLEECTHHSLTFGKIFTKDNALLDEVIVSLYHAPHSYTGEDCVEISCHGSTYILHELISTLTAHGANMAEPGEFTKRAFANGKMDLSQAEAVADLIAAETTAQHALALRQMRGGISNELHKLREKLLHFSTLLELELDFSDHEDLEFANRLELNNLSGQVEKSINRLAESFNAGNAIKKGIPVALVGGPNAGKSTLLNALLGEEKAIVSHIAGTTRDSIDGSANIGGYIFRFIDTAGIRQTTNEIEAIGIERTFERLKNATIAIWLIDTTNPDIVKTLPQLAEPIQEKLQCNHLIILLNKCDCAFPSSTLRHTLLNCLEMFPPETLLLPFSNLRSASILRLKKLLLSIANTISSGGEEILISNQRHYQALLAALNAIRHVRSGLNNGLSGDLLTDDIRECIHYLSEIMGEITSEDILKNIFHSFCIGK